ncbi:unnamed protein product [Gongylonema pulchrum]|uniref:WYL domain-containing protein n=1 Tax=Gongylonema pulchrum TaxID=637853 RepID=A0A183D6L7_9BILA|nr:unnamed protein product [Gongylonema pulchrum]
MKIRFYAQRESDLHCIGPGNGTLKILAHNSTIAVKVFYQYEALPGLQIRTIEWHNQVLYVDNQRLLLYWCFKRAKNGSCVQHDADILVRSRHLAYHDMALLKPYLKMACAEQQHLRWFDLHCTRPCIYSVF